MKILQKICFIICIFILPWNLYAESGEIYQYKNLFPVLLRNWYFQDPFGICIQEQNLYVADRMNDRIRKLSLEDGKVITEWGKEGTSDGEFIMPFDVASDPKGFIYVTDSYKEKPRIQKFTSDGVFLRTWGSDLLTNPTYITTDSFGDVYVSDTDQNRIYKFSVDGVLLLSWGKSGNGPGQFDWPYGLAVDNENHIYVADYRNERIQKFNQNGEFLLEWGQEGQGEGEFDGPSAVATDGKAYVYVAEAGNNRVQQFDLSGNFIREWKGSDLDQKLFFDPRGIAVNKEGSVFVSDTGNDRIRKFSSTGKLMEDFGRGAINSPEGIAMYSPNAIYLADTDNHRILKFDSSFQIIRQWGKLGTGVGEFRYPQRIAVDNEGFVYVTEKKNHRVQKFDPDGQFVLQWGGIGFGEGKFVEPMDICIKENRVYVADKKNDRIQVFTLNGDFESAFGNEGEEKLNLPEGVAVADNDVVYVADTENHCIKKFSNGQFVSKWGEEGESENQFNSPTSITIDSDGFFYVSDSDNHRIQKFKEENGELLLLTVIGEEGSNPGQLKYPGSLAVWGDDVYVADNYNHRIQIFKKKDDDLNTKAIIVAGGGPYPGNRLWDATRLSANFAYYSLIYQGLQKADISYLSSDSGIDLDNNGETDDILPISDSSSTAIKTLENKIKTWASDADRLILYLVDHGGASRFSLREKEILTAEELNDWLDVFQNDNDKEVIVIYDACKSGSFQPLLRTDSQEPPADCPLEIKPRIIISSAGENQSAYFLNQGTISFSEFFWSEVFNGADLKSASDKAKELISYVTSAQSPGYSVCGGFKKNKEVKIGYGTEYFSDKPDSVIEKPEISGEDVKVIKVITNHTVEISRLWAVLIPENMTVSEDSSIIEFPSDSTIIGFPSQELQPSDDADICGDLGENKKCYTGILSFNEIRSGERIAVYATDINGNKFNTKITADAKEMKSRALLISSGDLTDENISDAYDALLFQGFYYTDDDETNKTNKTNIKIIAPDDIKSYLSDIKEEEDKEQGIDDLIIYINGPENKISYDLLYQVQNRINGNLIFIYEGDAPGDIFLPPDEEIPPEEKTPILISAASAGGEFSTVNEISVSFSGFFWDNIRNGMTLWQAFSQAGENLRLFGLDVNTRLDDNGNRISNESGDGIRSADIRIGRGIALVPNSPLRIFPEIVLEDRETSAVLQVVYADTKNPADSVYAIIEFPGIWEDEMLVDDVEAETIMIPMDMDEESGNLYEVRYENFEGFGIYRVTFYAGTGEEKTAFYSTSVFQSAGADLYEPDDNIDTAKIYTIEGDAQHHSFHAQGDIDYVKFYALEGTKYTIFAKDHKGAIAGCVDIKLFSKEGYEVATSKNNTGKLIYTPNKSMILNVALSSKSSECNDYFIDIDLSTAPFNGYLKGTVKDAASGQIIEEAMIKVDNISAISRTGSGKYLMVIPSGRSYTISVNAPGYIQANFRTANIPETGTVTQDLYLTPVPAPVQDRYPTAKIMSPPADNRSITEGNSITFQGNALNGDYPLTYSWDFDGGADPQYMEDPGEVVFHNAGNYKVTFTVWDADGDVSEDSINIRVNEYNPPVYIDPDENPGTDIDTDGDPDNSGEDDDTVTDQPVTENPTEEPVTDIIFCPELIKPEDGTTNIPLSPDFAVEFETNLPEDLNAPIYWQISSYEDFSEFVSESEIDFAGSFTPSILLEPETIYFWRVECIGSEDESHWSEVWSFTTLEEPEQDTPEAFQRPFEESSLEDAGGMGCFIDLLVK